MNRTARGVDEDCDWTVADWRDDQGVTERDEVNAEWTDLVVRKRSFPANIKLTEQGQTDVLHGQLQYRQVPVFCV